LIDITNLYSTNLSDRKVIASQIHTAASTTGFFYISNHGIPLSITAAAHASTLAFFKQPHEIKECVNARGSDGGLEGWKPAGSQRINEMESVDQRETFSMRYSPHYDPLTKQSDAIVEVSPAPAPEFLWENDGTRGLDGFREDIVRYWTYCLSLARKLLATFALGLGMSEDAFDQKVRTPDAVLALNFYPSLSPKPTEQEPDLVSIGSHTDFQLLTILYQDLTGGLQILNPSTNEWINAPPIPGTLVINIGDLMQRITNDRYVSTVHRARNFSGKERVSMPFFFGFGLGERAEVLDCCVDEERGEPRRYEDVGCGEWVTRRARGMYVR